MSALSALEKRNLVACILVKLNFVCVSRRLEVDTADEAAGQLLQRPARVPGQEGQLLLHPPDRWGVAARRAHASGRCGVGSPRALACCEAQASRVGTALGQW